ncbi:KH domain-containing protein HEN4 [Lactuca sativa]|uniref:K Homology domain-containing protein n=1 Tax=Lactuca sativa TaxID=4236 RepID=A0A9R1UIL5_LACSA|nr:KH domain-containing protein HEN4 [Lactuca sativa]KAJ0187583.1 hypothetical protein LSAT_V11C900488080 [Lactuca sativa]
MSSQLTPSKRGLDEGEASEANGKGKLQKSTDTTSQNTSFIVFRVVCPASKTESVIGKEGNKIRGANVRVEETIPGCNDRVIVIEGSDGISNDQKKEADDAEEHEEDMASCVQKGLLCVFERMVEGEAEMNEETFVVRLLVVSTQVGCLLGKSGGVIKQMASESGAEIRILPRDKLPACASSCDELVQISGEVSAVRKALESVSQQLLDHPASHRDKSGSLPANNVIVNNSNNICEQDPHPHPHPHPHHHPNGRAGHREGGRFGPFTDMLTYRLICPDEKVGGVIGKGGATVKALKHETGCDIKVLERSVGSDDRIIVISGPAVPDERICAPQDAVLRVQTRIFRAAPETKAVTAKVIVSAHQIGCILGKGGAVISEMRNSTGAFIRILGKDQTPQYAAENEEVVQINGEFDAVQEALFQITTALRNHYFRDAFPSMNHPPNPPFPSSYMGMGRYSSSFNRFDDRPPPPFMHDRPGFSHPHQPWAPQGIEGGAIGFSEYGGAGAPQRRMGGFGGGSHQAIITNTTVEVIVPRNVVPCIYGEDGGCLKQIREISDARITITDPKPGEKETLIIISGTPEQAHAAQSLIQAFVISETQVSVS